MSRHLDRKAVALISSRRNFGQVCIAALAAMCAPVGRLFGSVPASPSTHAHNRVTIGENWHFVGTGSREIYYRGKWCPMSLQFMVIFDRHCLYNDLEVSPSEFQSFTTACRDLTTWTAPSLHIQNLAEAIARYLHRHSLVLTKDVYTRLWDDPIGFGPIIMRYYLDMEGR